MVCDYEVSGDDEGEFAKAGLADDRTTVNDCEVFDLLAVVIYWSTCVVIYWSTCCKGAFGEHRGVGSNCLASNIKPATYSSIGILASRINVQRSVLGMTKLE